MRRIAFSFGSCLLALTLLSCSSGSDEGPTGPGPVTRNLLISFVVENAAGVQSLTGARLLFDGRQIDRFQGAAARSVGFNIAVERVTPGAHTVGITVEHTVQAAVQYSMGGATQNRVTVSNPASGTIAVLTLPRDVIPLTNGQGHEYTIQVP